MCDKNCDLCFDAHASQALDLMDRVHAQEMAAVMVHHPVEKRIPDWSWRHTARMVGVAAAQAMLIAVVVLSFLMVMAYLVAKLSLVMWP